MFVKSTSGLMCEEEKNTIQVTVRHKEAQAMVLPMVLPVNDEYTNPHGNIPAPFLSPSDGSFQTSTGSTVSSAADPHIGFVTNVSESFRSGQDSSSNGSIFFLGGVFVEYRSERDGK